MSCTKNSKHSTEHTPVMLHGKDSPGIISSGFPKASTGVSGVGKGWGGSGSVGSSSTVTGFFIGGFGRTV